MMMKEPKRKWGRWVVAGGFALLMLLVILSMTGVITPGGAFGFVARAVAPVQRLAQGAVDGVRDWMNRRAYQEDLDLAYNELLEKYNAARAENEELIELRLETERLTELLGYKEAHPEYTMIHARVIARDPNEWFTILIIDRGTRHGVDVGMPVTTNNGVVGRILEADATTSQVLTLYDGRSYVPCMVRRTRDMGILEGNYGADPSQPTLLTKLSVDAALVPGDDVLTSGIDSFYPRGLYIGQVGDIQAISSSESRVIVKPAADIHRLENVLVIMEVKEPSAEPSQTAASPTPPPATDDGGELGDTAPQDGETP